MLRTVESLEQTLKANVGDPMIRIVKLSERRQILCRETDEGLVQTLTERYAPPEVAFEVMGF